MSSKCKATNYVGESWGGQVGEALVIGAVWGPHRCATKSQRLFLPTMGSLLFLLAKLDLFNVCGFLELICY